MPDISFLLAQNESERVCLDDLLTGGIDLWWVPLPDVSITALYEQYRSILSAREHQRFVSQRLPKGQLQFLLARIVLRHLFSAYHAENPPGHWLFGKSETGRPMVDSAQSRLEFNLTHTGDVLLIAVSGSGRPGIDAERLGRPVEVSAIARRYFNSSEALQILDAAPEIKNELFLRYWTLKESAVKATGQGLSRALKRFSFFAPMTEDFAYADCDHTDADHADEFKFWSATADNHAIAVCLLRSGNETAQQVRITSRRLVWPTVANNGFVSTLNINWRESK